MDQTQAIGLERNGRTGPHFYQPFTNTQNELQEFLAIFFPQSWAKATFFI
jgi:hypothetical protein